MDEQYSGLVCFTPDLVGASNTCVDLRGLRAGDRSTERTLGMSSMQGISARSGDRRIGYLVLFRSVAFFDHGVAGDDDPVENVLSHVLPRYGF